MDAEVQRRVVDSINNVFGSSLSSAGRAGEVQAELLGRLASLDSRLELASSSAPTQLHTALASCDQLQGQVDRLAEEQDRHLVTAGEAVEEVSTFRADSRELLSDIGCVRGVVQYSVWLQLADSLGGAVEAGLAEGPTGREAALEGFLQLRGARDALAQSGCLHLRRYLGELVLHWYQQLHDRLVAELEAGLASLGWPFVQLGAGRRAEELEASMSVQELQALAGALLELQEPEAGPGNQSTLVMKALVKPLRKRFCYHFLGTKSTNNPAKPEWYTTQLVQWATAHTDFLDLHIQPVYDRHHLLLPARLEFGAGLVALATEKLRADLPLVHPDDMLLAHTIDEAIVLARELAARLHYSSAQPSVLAPLTEGAVFSRWLNMERKFAFEKLDTVLGAGEAAWAPEPGGGLVPRAADSFLAILLSVTERYKFLTASRHRLDFLELQLQLLEDFRLRLVQLMRAEQEEPLQSHFCPILCTAAHLTTVLASWAETPFFLQLEQQRVQEGGEGEAIQGTVFDETIAKLEYLQGEMVSAIVEWIMFGVRGKSRAYRKEVKWFSILRAEAEVQPAACGMLQAIAFHLDSAQRLVPGAVFTQVWRRLAGALGSFLLEELVLPTRFSREGGRQLETDLRRGLLPILGAFTPRPEAHLPALMDAVRLLAAQAGTLLLALDSLAAAPAAAAATLAELGISRLSAEQAVQVIRTRVDLEIM